MSESEDLLGESGQPPRVSEMTLSYLVSTAGHSQRQNELYPHNVTTILQLVEEGAEELQGEKVVGFTSLRSGRWVCDRYCTSSHRPWTIVTVVG